MAQIIVFREHEEEGIQLWMRELHQGRECNRRGTCRGGKLWVSTIEVGKMFQKKTLRENGGYYYQ